MGHIIIQELQRVFGHMQEGISKVYDPGRFAKLLGIDNGIQQDPQVGVGMCVYLLNCT